MTETQPIWDSLSSTSIGVIVSWIIVILTIASVLCAGTIKLYKVFEKYKSVKDKDEKQEKIIESHDSTLKEIEESLKEIKNSLKDQNEINLKQLRYTIVHICEDALDKGDISINKLRSLEEFYQDYTDKFHNANGYVKTLVTRVRKLKIVGKTDD